MRVYAQADIHAEQMGTNVLPAVALVGDLRATAGQLADELEKLKWRHNPASQWWMTLRASLRT